MARGIMSVLSNIGLDRDRSLVSYAYGFKDGTDGAVSSECDQFSSVVAMVGAIMKAAHTMGWDDFAKYDGMANGIYESVNRMNEGFEDAIPVVVNMMTVDILLKYLSVFAAEGEVFDMFNHCFRAGTLAMEYVGTKDDVKSSYHNMVTVLINFALVKWGKKFADGIDIIIAADEAKRFPDGTFHRDEDGMVVVPEGWVAPDLSALFV